MFVSPDHSHTRLAASSGDAMQYDQDRGHLMVSTPAILVDTGHLSCGIGEGADAAILVRPAWAAARR